MWDQTKFPNFFLLIKQQNSVCCKQMNIVLVFEKIYRSVVSAFVFTTGEKNEG